MIGSPTHYRRAGWSLALAWAATAISLVLSLPKVSSLGEVVVFGRWSLIAIPVAGMTWVWAFSGRRTSGLAVGTLTGAALTWTLLLVLGQEAWIHLAIRDAFFLRQSLLEAVLRSVLWLYLIFPLLVMTGGVTAVVEYIRHPPEGFRQSDQAFDE
jgi:hypothetical protein